MWLERNRLSDLHLQFPHSFFMSSFIMVVSLLFWTGLSDRTYNHFDFLPVQAGEPTCLSLAMPHKLFIWGHKLLIWTCRLSHINTNHIRCLVCLLTMCRSGSPTFFQAVIDMSVMIHRQSCLLHVFSHWRRARGGGFKGQAMVGVQHYHSERRSIIW